MEQHHELVGGIESFVPRPEEVPVARIDGMCVLIPREVISRVGYLDQRHFGRHGWGAIDDYYLRVRRRGYKVAVTHRSFVQHLRKRSAVRTVRYDDFAQAEMVIGMTRKYGRHWRDNFEPGQYGERPKAELLNALVRSAQERVGLGRVEWRQFLKRDRSG